MGNLCTECSNVVDDPKICWDGGAFDGEPVHERCIGDAQERMFAEAAQIHRDLMNAAREEIARLRAKFGLTAHRPDDADGSVGT
jgi:hypothetical protein